MDAYLFDSSALVKRFAKETGTGFVLMRPAVGHAIYVSRLTEVETSAALARRHKAHRLTATQWQKARQRLRRDFNDRLIVIAVPEGLVRTALRLTETHALRGYDALQLVTALEANRQRLAHQLPPLTLVSADGELNQSAQAEGLVVENPNNYS